MVSGGNPKYAAGTQVTLRAVSGHRDGTLTDCPGDTIYAQLPADRRRTPTRAGCRRSSRRRRARSRSYPVRFAATLSTSLIVDGARARRGGHARSRASPARARASPGPGTGARAPGAPVAPGRRGELEHRGAGRRRQPRAARDRRPARHHAPVAQGRRAPSRVAPSSISPDGDGQADAATVTFSRRELRDRHA